MLLKFGNIVELQSQTRVRSSKVSFGSVASILEGRTININLVQKSDMVLKATEVKHAALQKFLKRSHITRRNTLSELEEFRIREVDITLAQKIFEHRVILEGVDSLTQRIPAEKFLKYMHDWLRAASSDIEKLRLRTTHMKLQYKKACSVLEVRQELAKTLHAVDLDRLVIENRRLSKEYETKMVGQP
nr:unnamed protein product [Callosobruchus chinensis]